MQKYYKVAGNGLINNKGVHNATSGPNIKNFIHT